MNLEFEPLSKEIIGSVIEVHKILGPGLFESVYEECMEFELAGKGLIYERQKPVPVTYNEIVLSCGYRIDFLVERQIVVEIKSLERIHAIHGAQVLTYLRLSNVKTALLINFNVCRLKNGIIRFVY